MKDRAPLIRESLGYVSRRLLLTPAAVLHVGAELARALEFVHGGRVTMGPLCADEVRFTPGGGPTLSSLRGKGMPAPEVCVGGSPDAQSDLWSLGAVLLEAALGRSLLADDIDVDGRMLVTMARGRPLHGRLLDVLRVLLVPATERLTNARAAAHVCRSVAHTLGDGAADLRAALEAVRRARVTTPLGARTSATMMLAVSDVLTAEELRHVARVAESLVRRSPDNSNVKSTADLPARDILSADELAHLASSVQSWPPV